MCMCACVCVSGCVYVRSGASSSHLGYRYIYHLPHSPFPLPYSRPLLYAIPLPCFPITYFPFTICFHPPIHQQIPILLEASHSLIPLLRFSSFSKHLLPSVFVILSDFSGVGVFFRFIQRGGRLFLSRLSVEALAAKRLRK